MYHYQSIKPSDVRNINKTAALEYTRTHKTVSRSELANALELSLPSVERIVDDLLAQGLIKYTGERESSGGRKRPLMEIYSENNIAVSALVSNGRVDCSLIDLSGKVLERKSEKTVPDDLEQIADALLELIGPLHERAKNSSCNYWGIAVEVPYVVGNGTGIVKPSKDISFPLGDIIRSKFDVPVAVENDSNAAALGEMWYGNNIGVYNLALVHLRKGLGVGLIVDGCIYRGSSNAAGELGYLVFSKDNFTKKKDGLFGPVEKKVAGIGLLTEAHEALSSLGRDSDDITYDTIFAAYKDKEDWAVRIINNLADNLAMIITTVSCTMDCEKIILSGEVIDAGGFLIDMIQEKVYEDILVEHSKVGLDAIVLGGFVTLMQRQNAYCHIKYLIG